MSHKSEKTNSKGMDEYIVVPIGIFFILLLAIVVRPLGELGLIQSHVLVQQKFAFESKFSNLIGESNQIMSVKNPKIIDKKLVTLNKSLDKFSYWLAFYAHANNTKSSIYLNVTNPDSEKISLSSLKKIIQNQMNYTANLTLPRDIFYSIKFKDIVIKNKPKKEIKNLGLLIFPIPVPGEKIEYFKFGREGTTYNLILTQKEG